VCPARYEKIAHDGGVCRNYELKATGRGLPITQRSGGATLEPPVIGKASDRACSRTGRLLRTPAQVLTAAAHVNFTNGNKGKFDLASLHGWWFLHDRRVASSHPGERTVRTIDARHPRRRRIQAVLPSPTIDPENPSDPSRLADSDRGRNLGTARLDDPAQMAVVRLNDVGQRDLPAWTSSEARHASTRRPRRTRKP
jgi:hypothetical protein